ncbi:MAG: hypothetical protein H6942_12870 [Candidatus Accumulibacter sp.]|uniref:GSU2403 family nucleotidyltransferase fold protein n=1 Tax=Accumulibacter sp. TaxID=2053492 RepID=UPI0025D2317A|nr:GSU2403 family nucleotidyltransferase fold protein [Accumulibacter sp.]MCP5249404.1 hypothetical protein [Accumulibacter sp.]
MIKRLADYGFFRAGGLLIGTHAFIAIGNVLGVRWADSQRTQLLISPMPAGTCQLRCQPICS